MNIPYHQKPVQVAFISPSLNLFAKSQDSLKHRLGRRARLVPFDCVREAERAVRDPQTNIEMVVLDSAAIPSLNELPQFLGAGEIALPVLLLLRKGETEVAESAMEAGYKALLFIDSDVQYRQLFPGMILRMIAFFRGERQRERLDEGTAAVPVEHLGLPEHSINGVRN